jgi:hypothetical protein
MDNDHVQSSSTFLRRERTEWKELLEAEWGYETDLRKRKEKEQWDWPDPLRLGSCRRGSQSSWHDLTCSYMQNTVLLKVVYNITMVWHFNQRRQSTNWSLTIWERLFLLVIGQVKHQNCRKTSQIWTRLSRNCAFRCVQNCFSSQVARLSSSELIFF